MEAAGILAGLGGLRGLASLIGRRMHSAIEQTAPADTSNGKPSEAVAPSDLHSISPRELSRLAHRLFAAGAITAGEYQELNTLRSELEVAAGSPDERLDVVELLTDKLQRLEAASQEPDASARDATGFAEIESQVRRTRRQLDLLSRMNALSTGRASALGHHVDAAV